MNTTRRDTDIAASLESPQRSSASSRLRRGGRYAVWVVCWLGWSLPLLAQSFGDWRPVQALGLQGGTATASAERPTRESDCVNPASRISLNDLFGVPEQFVLPALICRDPLTAGEHWRAIWSYFGADAASAVYPQGYVPLYANPVDDILAKLTIAVIVDGGTSQQKTYTFFPTDTDTFRTDVRIHDLNPAFPDIPSFFIIPRMAPLSPGHHTYQLLWVQSARHCDGTSTDEGRSCLPAGAYPSSVRRFDVTIPQPGVD